MGKRMDVCMLVEAADGFDGRIKKEARSLSRAGYGVELISLRDRKAARREEIDGYRIRRISVLTRALRGRIFFPFKLFEFYVRYQWAALRSRARVYHAHHPIVLLPVVVAALVWRARIIYDMHELHYSLHGGRIGRRVFKIYERLMIRFVDRLIMSDGESRANAFLAEYGISRPIDYVYNYSSRRSETENGADLRTAFVIPSDEMVVVYSGAIRVGRGLETAVLSMAAWPADAHFVLLGYGTDSHKSELLNLSQKVGAQDRVHFQAAVPPDDVSAWLASADLSLVLIEDINLSYRYSAPTKMFDAVMAGIPQLASDFPEIRRVVLGNPVGPVGAVVDSGDSAAIGLQVSVILSDRDARLRFSENARRLADTEFNWERQEDVFLGLYRDLIPVKSVD